jgi:arylsulfatase A-like enzyme
VVAKYDGNLRAADHAFGLVLTALEKRPRWRDTVVLVTSDHGEAFLEHGQTHHNSTVYDEMLHVPFVLRLPERFDRSAIDTDRLVTLSDIVPTLLAAAGLSAPPEIDGFDLTEPSSHRASASERFFVARNDNRWPVYGLRSLRWKLVLSSSGQGALYDLERDPGEHRDIKLDEVPRFLGLSQLLIQTVTSPPSLGSSEERAATADRDEEMLRALGYVE